MGFRSGAGTAGLVVASEEGGDFVAVGFGQVELVGGAVVEVFFEEGDGAGGVTFGIDLGGLVVFGVGDDPEITRAAGPGEEGAGVLGFDVGVFVAVDEEDGGFFEFADVLADRREAAMEADAGELEQQPAEEVPKGGVVVLIDKADAGEDVDPFFHGPF